jgi:tRNA(Ile)-lysidine synthase
MVPEVAAMLSDELKLSASDRILVALSGGLDSVTLGYVLLRLGYAIGLAHVNYGLRGADSDADEAFAAHLAVQWGLPFFVTRFDTKNKAAAEGRSVQELARELRYTWLEEIRAKEGFDWIATAHHRNDAIETALFHFARGTGIHGLRGIPVRNQCIIRPLIRLFRSDILDFARRTGLSWREDASNESSLYQRNYLRNEVIPKLEGLHGGFTGGAGRTIDLMRSAGLWYDWAIEHWKKQVCSREDEVLRLDKQLVHAAPDPGTLLWEILHPLGFSAAQLSDILDPSTRTGAVFEGKGQRLVNDRDYWLLRPWPEAEMGDYSLELGQEELVLPDVRIRCFPEGGIPAVFPDDPGIVYLALDQNDFPLRIRKWRAGDLFQPFGMGGKHQKIQDLLSNRKMSLPEKEKIWVLATADGRICWVVGLRTDERFRVKPDSRQVWRLEIKK